MSGTHKDLETYLDDDQLPQALFPILKVVQEKPVRLTMLNRTKYHNYFMAGITHDLNGLKRWIKEFYCAHYLRSDLNNRGKLDKATQILLTMDFISKEVATINEYLNYVVVEGEPTLVQLIGGNRVSHRTSKTPWGLQMIIDNFDYKKQNSDTSAKGTNLSKPLETPQVKVNHFISDIDISRF